jgi:hypothetical protein
VAGCCRAVRVRCLLMLLCCCDVTAIWHIKALQLRAYATHRVFGCSKAVRWWGVSADPNRTIQMQNHLHGADPALFVTPLSGNRGKRLGFNTDCGFVRFSV